MTITEAKKRVQQAVSGYDQIRSAVVEDMDTDIVRANREQLMQGITANDKKISPAYTALTKRIKQSKGQPTNRVTLFDSGSFQEAMFSRLQDREVIIDSTDEKRDELTAKYGERIFGIDDEHSDRLKQISITKIIKYIKEITHF